MGPKKKIDNRPASTLPSWKQGLLVHAYEALVSTEIVPNVQVQRFIDNVVLLGPPEQVQRASVRNDSGSASSAPGLTCRQRISCTRSGPSERLVASWACRWGILPPPPPELPDE